MDNKNIWEITNNEDVILEYSRPDLQYADFQEEENKAERYCWDDIAATLRN